MASSVSSEWAFSLGGITVSKRRNRLKGDIVETLQFLKCLIKQDLLFREAGPSSKLEDTLDNDGAEPADDLELLETEIPVTSVSSINSD